MSDPTLIWEDDGGPCAPEEPQKSCGTCRHWKPQPYGDSYGICGVIIHGGPYTDAAEIVGGGQGVSEPVQLETHCDLFWCALWEAE